MNRKIFFIMIAILTLASVTLACSLFGGGDEPAEVAPVEDASPAEDVSPAEAEEVESQPTPTDKPDESQPVPDPNLGDEYRSEVGGYAFQPIPDYTVEEFYGMAFMEAPESDPDLGPFIMLVGGINEEEEMSTEQIFEEFNADMDTGSEILDQREITVGGVSRHADGLQRRPGRTRRYGPGSGHGNQPHAAIHHVWPLAEQPLG